MAERAARFGTGNLYLVKMDGSWILLTEGMPLNDERIFSPDDSNSVRVHQYLNYKWYADKEGYCYCYVAGEKAGENNRAYSLCKIDPSGSIVYETLLEPGVWINDLFQLPDGRMYIVTRDSAQERTKIAELDPDTGKVSGQGAMIAWPGDNRKFLGSKSACAFGTDADNHIYMLWPSMPGGGFYELDPSDGSLAKVLGFDGTTYRPGDSSIDMSARSGGWSQEDFRIMTDGSIEVLWYKPLSIYDGSTSMTIDGQEIKIPVETLSLGVVEKVKSADTDRKIITIRGNVFTDWMRKQTARFNRSSADWQVVLEEYAASNADSLEEYARLTSVQTAAGRGPDMLYGDFMDNFLYGMAGKGILLNLAPLMEKSGIREEDYLPLVFDVWRDGEAVYGITPEGGTPFLYTINSQVLEGAGTSDEAGTLDAEVLAAALSSWEGDAALYGFDSAETCLRHFLEGSGNLWGMVDWEHGKCSFDGELFASLLEISRRYGYDERLSRPNLVRHTLLSDILHFDTSEELDATGRTVCGTLFDGGCGGAARSGHTMAINAASGSVEGTWKFLCFLLGDEAQQSPSTFPVKKDLLAAWAKEQADMSGEKAECTDVDVSYVDNGELVRERKILTAADMTQERVDEYLKTLEEVRALPLRNAPVLTIICEEAADYFNGNKSIKNVVKIIENRVGLYLEEQR